MELSRQEYWSGLPCPPPGDPPNPENKPASLTSPVLAGRFFTTSATWEGPPRCQTHTNEVLLVAVYLSLNKEMKTNSPKHPKVPKDHFTSIPLGLEEALRALSLMVYRSNAADDTDQGRGGRGGCENPAPLQDAARSGIPFKSRAGTYDSQSP
ncbi:unnamed protein product [Rangifer tarandus platyrhynchus]|uniref:Uncharacterized protein n=1 Tax=Rangifer tarandus platyrhynchus TaxID=3082113 RepID=A0AC59ZBA2_RANTA